MKALCLVAHPDDCVIFGMSFILAHPSYQWTVGYLTYGARDARARELETFWQRRGISTVFLGFEDHWHDNEQQAFTRWDPEDAAAACEALAQNFDLVLTHAADGDYGHIHHKLVHHAVKQHDQVVTFCPLGEGLTFSVESTAYSLDELPLHAEVVRGFHMFAHRNSYRKLQCD